MAMFSRDMQDQETTQEARRELPLDEWMKEVDQEVSEGRFDFGIARNIVDVTGQKFPQDLGYTVGVGSLHKVPDVAWWQVFPDDMAPVLEQMIRAYVVLAKNDKIKLPSGKDYTTIKFSEEFSVRIIAVCPEYHDNLFVMGHMWYEKRGEKPSFVQMIFPDSNGKFWGESGVDSIAVAAQLLLNHVELPPDAKKPS